MANVRESSVASSITDDYGWGQSNYDDGSIDVVIASMVGASGLGEQVLVSINRIDIALGFEAGISIVFLAIIIDRITNGVADKLQKHRRVS